MTKTKTIIVTAALTVMLLLIMGGLLALNFIKAFACISGVFAVYGLTNAVCALYGWLRDTQEEAPSVPEVFADPEAETAVEGMK